MWNDLRIMPFHNSAKWRDSSEIIVDKIQTTKQKNNGVIYKDMCNPITAEFREELYTNILDAYARIKEPEKEETQKQDRTQGTKGSFEILCINTFL